MATAVPRTACMRDIVTRSATLLVLMIAVGAPPTPALAQEAKLPFPDDEQLAYSIAWPSGLTVGEGAFRARRTEAGWRFEMTLRASLPTIEIDDVFLSTTDGELCSSEFEKHIRHGLKRAHESLRFGRSTLERTNLDPEQPGRAGTAPIPSCAQDALAFVYFLRRDLAAGRIPSERDILFGAGYRVRLDYAQTRWLTWNSERRLADEIRVDVRGPASRHSFSVYFGRDRARTPLLFRAEFDSGPFTMQLSN